MVLVARNVSPGGGVFSFSTNDVVLTVYGLVVNILLFISIFVIYFRSPVIQGLEVMPMNQYTPPANRLVIFVLDGLRAESFFKDECDDIPNIRKLIVQGKGLLGVSHTRVPTESRPGHIALMAGLYEDPSSVTRGWKENPVEFDTIFKHSTKTYAWGAHDVLHIFNKWSQADDENRLFFDAYNHDLDFSNTANTIELDEWVFERVEKVLRRKRDELNKYNRTYFFLHLLGMDSAGHIHKPDSDLFLKNLHFTDKGIYRMYELFESIFPDNMTTYVLTSDHGMTNSGSHGASQPHETETPFYIWGAGVNWRHDNTEAPIPTDSIELPVNEESNNDDITAGNVRYRKFPLYEIEQAQFAPLMASFLGLPPPTNNLGILPKGFIEASDEFIANAVSNNALQLLEQYGHLLREHERGLFSLVLPEYKKLTRAHLNGYQTYVKRMGVIEDYKAIINASYAMMNATVNGIEYYHGYYRWPLLIATSFTFISWIWFLLTLLDDTRMMNSQMTGMINSGGVNSNRSVKATHTIETSTTVDATADNLILSIINDIVRAIFPENRIYRRLIIEALVFTIGLCFMQRTPIVVCVYFVLPILTFSMALTAAGRLRCNILRGYGYGLMFHQSFTLLVVTELLVLTFFKRQNISLAYIVLTLVDRKFYYSEHKIKSLLHFLIILILSVFPLLPIAVGYKHDGFVVLGLLFSIVYPLLSSGRGVVKFDVYVVMTVFFNSAVIIWLQNHLQQPLPLPCQLISWSYFVYCFVIISSLLPKSLQRRLFPNATNTPLHNNGKLNRIIFLLSPLYAMLCTSYETLFILLLICELRYWMKEVSKSSVMAKTSESNQQLIMGNLAINISRRCNNNNKSKANDDMESNQFVMCFRFAFAILVYTLFSFFGTGNTASISSFDPNIIRCFLTTFSPFIIMFLVIVKLIIPAFMIVSIFYNSPIFTLKFEHQVFISLWIIGNLMSMNFLFFVRNYGSWLEIGSSISHYVIMQAITMVLVLLSLMAKDALALKERSRLSRKN